MRGIKIAGKIISKIILIVMILLILMNLYTIVMRFAFKEKQPSVLGFSTAVVISGSMEPAINVDDMVVIRERASYDIGDIIMYEGEHSLITHRIVRLEDGNYITRGDANNTDDPPVSGKKVVGKVVLIIPGVGRVISFLQTPLGMLIMVLTAVVLLALPDLLGKVKKHGRADDEADG